MKAVRTVAGRPFLVFLSLFCAGCLFNRKPPPAPPPAPPPIALSISHFVGTPLSGPTADAPSTKTAADALSIHATFVALDKMPAVPGNSVGAMARLIIVSRGGVPVMATANLTESARLASFDDADQFRQTLGTNALILGTLNGALPGGVTATLSAAEITDQPRFISGQPLHRRIEVNVNRPRNPDPSKSPLQVALAIEDVVTPASPGDTNDDMPQSPNAKDKKPATRPAPAPPVVWREVAIFDRPPMTDHDQFAVIVPYRFGDSSVRAVAIIVQIASGSADADHQTAAAKCLDDIKTSASAAATRPYLSQSDNADWPSLASALDSIQHGAHPRAGLVFLASHTNAGVFEDVALVADESTQQALVQRIVQKLGNSGAAQSKNGLGWLMDSATYQLIADQLATGKIPPEIAAILTLHAGEAGRHAGSVDEALRSAADRQSFELRLTAENYIFLEDSSPASRVRAFDWLRSEGREPAGYDPLGPAKQRHAALEKSLAQTTAPASAGGKP